MATQKWVTSWQIHVLNFSRRMLRGAFVVIAIMSFSVLMRSGIVTSANTLADSTITLNRQPPHERLDRVMISDYTSVQGKFWTSSQPQVVAVSPYTGDLTVIGPGITRICSSEPQSHFEACYYLEISQGRNKQWDVTISYEPSRK